MTELTRRSEHRCHGGVQGFYEHTSVACAGPMRFSVFLPPAAVGATRVPVLYALAGSDLHRGDLRHQGWHAAYGGGAGAGAGDLRHQSKVGAVSRRRCLLGLRARGRYYLDATEAPWSSAYRMEAYVTEELPALVEAYFPVASDRRGILGHSVGGHGALTLALRHPDRYRSVSAFAPMVAPTQVPWGIQAFSRLLGPDRTRWAEHDAVELVKRRRFPGVILIDQGTADQFLDVQLRPALFSAACRETGQPLELRMHDGYDHGYWFIQTFVGEHLQHHASTLR